MALPWISWGMRMSRALHFPLTSRRSVPCSRGMVAQDAFVVKITDSRVRRDRTEVSELGGPRGLLGVSFGPELIIQTGWAGASILPMAPSIGTPRHGGLGRAQRAFLGQVDCTGLGTWRPRLSRYR